MKRPSAFLGALLLASLAVAGCGGDDGDDDTPPTATVAIEPTEPPPTPLPVEETGIAVVDDAVVAVEAGDTDTLVAMMVYTQVQCSSTPVPLYQVPPCGGAPEASLVDAFPMAACEGAYVPRADAEDGVRQTVDERSPATVYGIYRTDGTVIEDGFAGDAGPEYAVVFESTLSGTPWGWALLMSDEGLVGVLQGCAEPPAAFVANWGLSEPVP